MIKKTTFGVVLVLLIVLATASAVAGAFILQSQTTIHDNDMDSRYIVISSNDYTDFLTSADFNTTNVDDTISYELILDSAINGSATNNASHISETFTITVAKTDNIEGTTFDLNVAVSDFSPIAGLTYTMKVGTAYATYSSGWAFTGLALDTPLTVDLYISGTPTADPGESVGFANHTLTEDGSIFTFTATYTE